MSSFYSIPGPAGTIQIGTVSSVPSTDAATVTNSGTPEAAILNFEFPRSAVGSLVDGNAASPGIAFNSDPSTGFYLSGPGQLALSTNGTGRLFVDASGNVGVGTPTPSNYNAGARNFVIEGGSSTGLTIGTNTLTGNSRIYFADSTGGSGDRAGQINYEHTSNSMWFATDGGERLRIDSSGRLLVGTSTSSGTAKLLVQGPWNGGGGPAIAGVAYAGSAAPGINTTLAEYNYLSNTHLPVSKIVAKVDAAGWTEGVSHPTRLEFSTTADGASAPTERMRIDNLGSTTITKAGDLTAGTYALKVIGGVRSESVAGPFYGAYVQQIGPRYSTNIGLYSEVVNQSGYFGGQNYDHFSELRGAGVIGNAPNNSTAAYQKSLGVYGKANGDGQNYNSIYGVAGLATLGSVSFSNDTSDYQAGYGGHFLSHGKANSIGVYADAYLDASPGAGTHASPLVCATNGSEILRVTSDKYIRMSSSSGGIQFNGDTAAANALDDYEEGTFTPEFRDGATGTAALGYSQRTGKYTKIGNLVTYFIFLNDVNTTGLTAGNQVHITGLPFAAVNLQYRDVPSSVTCGAATPTTGSVSFTVTYNQSYGILLNNTTTGAASFTVSQATSGQFDCWISGQYYVS